MASVRLPRNPTQDQLRRLLKQPIRLGGAPRNAPAPLAARTLHGYLCFSELFRHPFPARELVDLVRPLDVAETIARLAATAAILANQGYRSPDAVSVTRGALAALAGSVHPRAGLIADFMNASAPDRALVHEKVLYFLQALVLKYGSDIGRAPSDQELAFLMFAGNDWLARWEVADERPLTELEGEVAELAHASRFNRGGDGLRDLVRGALLMGEPPPQGPLSSPTTFGEMQRAAFGMRYDEHVEQLTGPLFLQASLWGSRDQSGELRMPLLDPERWLRETQVSRAAAQEFFSGITMTVDEARAQIKVGADKLPTFPAAFISRPFLKLPNGNLLALSPWLVREQMRGGAWNRARVATRSLLGDSQVWLRAFGLMLEAWCRKIAFEAGKCSGFRGELMLPTASGDTSEIEDVVLLDGERVALFSVKGRVLPEHVKRAESRPKVLDWYESFFFEKSSGDQRGGALRLLNKKVEKIRRGDEPRISRTALLYPIVVTFEDVGDNVSFHRWARERCRAERLLGHDGVQRLTLVKVHEFERLMAVAANGGSVLDLLDLRAKIDDGLAPLDVIVSEYGGPHCNRRLEFMEREFEHLTERIQQRLFGRTQVPA